MTIAGFSTTKAPGVAALVAVVMVALLTGAAAAAPRAEPAPGVYDLHVTNFDPDITPADASFDQADLTFDPAGASFASQGFDFENIFTNPGLSYTVLNHTFVFNGTYGFCGGMTYAALDTFLSGNGTTTPQGSPTGIGGQSPGLGTVYPPDGGSVFAYIYNRQIDSLTGGSTLSTMADFMFLMTQHERDVATTHVVEDIEGPIDAGRPVPLLIVEALSAGQVVENHQVLATGYFRRGNPDGQYVVQVYDPNFPGRFMYLNTAEQGPYPYAQSVETYDAAGTMPSGVSFYGFFGTDYTYHEPPWAPTVLSTPTGNLINDPGADWIDSVWNRGPVNGLPPGTLETPTPEYGAADTSTVVVPPDWSPSGNFTAAQYSGPITLHGISVPNRLSPFPTTAFSAGIDGGNNLFAGGPDNSESSATQLLYLDDDATLDAAIDAGQQVATLSGDLGGSGSQPAGMVVTATFLSAGGERLGSVSIGPVTAAERDDQTGLLARSAAAGVPAATRTINVTMTASGAGGVDQYNTGLADNLSLIIGASSKIKRPVAVLGG